MKKLPNWGASFSCHFSRGVEGNRIGDWGLRIAGRCAADTATSIYGADANMVRGKRFGQKNSPVDFSGYSDELTVSVSWLPWLVAVVKVGRDKFMKRPPFIILFNYHRNRIY